MFLGLCKVQGFYEIVSASQSNCVAVHPSVFLPGSSLVFSEFLHDTRRPQALKTNGVILDGKIFSWWISFKKGPKWLLHKVFNVIFFYKTRIVVVFCFKWTEIKAVVVYSFPVLRIWQLFYVMTQNAHSKSNYRVCLSTISPALINRWFWLFCEQIDIRNEEWMGVVKFTQVCPGLCKIPKGPPKLLDAFCIVQNTLYSEKYFKSAKRVWNYFFILFLLVNQIAVVSPELIGVCFWLWACR